MTHFYNLISVYLCESFEISYPTYQSLTLAILSVMILKRIIYLKPNLPIESLEILIPSLLRIKQQVVL